MVEGIDASCLLKLLTVLGRKHGQVHNSVTLHRFRCKDALKFILHSRNMNKKNSNFKIFKVMKSMSIIIFKKRQQHPTIGNLA